MISLIDVTSFLLKLRFIRMTTIKGFTIKYGYMKSKQYDGYLFSIIIRGCFLNGNISEVHIYKEQTSRMDRAIFV